MQARTQAIAYFGKIPTHGDFVRSKVGGPALRAMDAWVQKGLYFAKTHLGSRLEAAYDAAGAFGFVYQGDEEAPLAGVLQPSRDGVGRAYPFLVAFEANGTSTAPDEAPVRYEAFFEQAAQVAGEAAAGAHAPQDLLAHTDQLGSVLASDDRGAFDHFLRETRLSTFWERLWGYADDTRKYLLFKNLLDILVPVRDGLPSGFPLVLRFPLGADLRTPAFDASFWLKVVSRLLGATNARVSFFWSVAGNGQDERPFLLLTLRPPVPALLAYLLMPDFESETLCVLENLGDQSAALAALAIPARYGQMLEDEQLTLFTFLERL